uniref:Uncharacterized protein n=1 Tax=Anguilla anguilla TaxID=7936 RepID=A0A0E9TE93_ANGAN
MITVAYCFVQCTKWDVINDWEANYSLRYPPTGPQRAKSCMVDRCIYYENQY